MSDLLPAYILILWIDLMSDSCCFCRRYQFMMCCKIFRLCLIFSFFKDKSRPHKWKVQNHVDLIKCQPVFYKSFVSCKEYCYKFLIELNQFSVLPASVLFGQMNRAIKMCNCNKWLNSVFVAFFKYIFIELKSCFIWFCIITVWKDS